MPVGVRSRETNLDVTDGEVKGRSADAITRENLSRLIMKEREEQFMEVKSFRYAHRLRTSSRSSVHTGP